MAHNLIIKDNLLYVSHYHDGLWIWDISDPSNPSYVASYDTYTPAGHESYRGAWGVYPLLPSGNILVSDMQYGLFVFAPPNEASSKIHETKNNVTLFPNPCNNIVHINTDSKGLKEYKVYDVYGNLVLLKKSMTKHEKLDLSTLSAGIYIINIDDFSTIHQNRIVKY